jgi:hypothetical protein
LLQFFHPRLEIVGRKDQRSDGGHDISKKSGSAALRSDTSSIDNETGSHAREITGHRQREPSATVAASDIDLYRRKTITRAAVMTVRVTARMIPSHVIREAIILPA